MKEEDYPLDHLSMDKRIEFMRKEVEGYKDALKKLAIKGLANQLQSMIDNIEELQNKFVEERYRRTFGFCTCRIICKL